MMDIIDYIVCVTVLEGQCDGTPYQKRLVRVNDSFSTTVSQVDERQNYWRWVWHIKKERQNRMTRHIGQAFNVHQLACPICRLGMKMLSIIIRSKKNL